MCVYIYHTHHGAKMKAVGECEFASRIDRAAPRYLSESEVDGAHTRASFMQLSNEKDC